VGGKLLNEEVVRFRGDQLSAGRGGGRLPWDIIVYMYIRNVAEILKDFRFSLNTRYM
jgi:hypothetical protein